MEKAMAAANAIITTMVETTPTQLREMATLMELSSQRAGATETTMIRLTDRISFIYQAPGKAADLAKEKSFQNRQPLPSEGSNPFPFELKAPTLAPRLDQPLNPQNLT